jgi:two-component system, sporulation sensor kinase E
MKKTKEYAKGLVPEAGKINSKSQSSIENVTIKAVGLGIILIVILELFYIKITHGTTFYPVVDFLLSIAVIMTVSVFFIMQGKQLENVVQDGDEKYRDLFENANELIQSVGIDGHFLYVNRKWQEVLGYSNDEVQRLKWTDVLREDQIPHCMEAFKRVCAGDVLDNLETVFMTKEGNEVIVQGNINAKFKNGEFIATRSIFHDVTERKRANEAMRESEERYRTLFENAQDGIALAEVDTGIIVDCNEALCRMVERSKEELLGQAQSILHPPQDLIEGQSPSFQQHRKAEAGQSSEDYLLSKTGKSIPVEIRAARIQIKGRMYLLGIFRDITERKRAEAALRESEERFRSFVEKSSDAVLVIGRDFRISYISPSFSRIFGRDPSQLLDKSAIEFMTKYVHPDDLDEMMKGFAECLARSGAESRMEFRFKHADDTWHHFVAIGKNHLETPSVDGLVANIRDITVQKMAEEELRNREAEWESLARNTPAIIFTADRDGKILFMNRTVSGFDLQEVIGKSVYDFIPPAYHKTMMEAIERAFETEQAVDYETQGAGPDGTVVWYSTRVEIIKRGGRSDTVILIASDITKRKQAELAVEEIMKKLEAKNRELEDYTYTISHDLKTPLVTIQGFAELLEKKYGQQLDEKGHHYVERITQSAEHLGTLVSGLLELSRAGRKTRPFKKINFKDILVTTLAGLEGKLREKKIEVSFPEQFPDVNCDDMRIEQALTNLIGNAVKYMGKEVKPRIEIGWKADGTRYVFWVKDNGTGIKKEDQERIFKVFERASSGSEGSGIGLSIVKKVVEMHDGEIWVESDIGKGSAFYFSLPSEEADNK